MFRKLAFPFIAAVVVALGCSFPGQVLVRALTTATPTPLPTPPPEMATPTPRFSCPPVVENVKLGLTIEPEDWLLVDGKRGVRLQKGFVTFLAIDVESGAVVTFLYQIDGVTISSEPIVLAEGFVYGEAIGYVEDGRLVSYGPILFFSCEKKVYFIDKNGWRLPLPPAKPPSETNSTA